MIGRFRIVYTLMTELVESVVSKKLTSLLTSKDRAVEGCWEALRFYDLSKENKYE